MYKNITYNKTISDIWVGLQDDYWCV